MEPTVTDWMSAISAVIIAFAVLWGLVWSPINALKKDLKAMRTQLDTLRGSTDTFIEMYARKGVE